MEWDLELTLRGRGNTITITREAPTFQDAVFQVQTDYPEAIDVRIVKHMHWCRKCGSLIVADRCDKPDKPTVCYDCVVFGLV